MINNIKIIVAEKSWRIDLTINNEIFIFSISRYDNKYFNSCMVDFVINHCKSEHLKIEKYLYLLCGLYGQDIKNDINNYHKEYHIDQYEILE